MKRALLMLMMLSLAGAAWGDEQTQAVQQALKDQGFYYGTVDGQGGPETDAAVRRYQIRQGLDVTGKLDEQTLSALNMSAGKDDGNTLQAVPAPAGDSGQAEQEATPPPKVVESDHNFLKGQAATPAPYEETAPKAEPAPRAEAVMPEEEQPDRTQPQEPPEQAPPPPGAMGDYEGQTPPKDYQDFFRKTPYETAPVVVQRNTVQQAQVRLGRQGFFRGVADSELSKSLGRAIGAYQREAGLRVTGRLDMPTLDDMNLLPKRRVVARPQGPLGPPGPPPYYGEPRPYDRDARPVYPGIWVR